MNMPITSSNLCWTREHLRQRLEGWTAGVEEQVTGIPGLLFHRREQSTVPHSCMVEPSVGFVLQGSLRALIGGEVITCKPGQVVIAALDMPVTLEMLTGDAYAQPHGESHTESHSELRANVQELSDSQAPYLGLALKIDLAVMKDVIFRSGLMPPAKAVSGHCLGVDNLNASLLDCFYRLVNLLDEPESIPVLAPLIQREIYYRLLTGEQGFRLWQIVSAGSQCHRIARAIDWLKQHYTKPLRIEELAALVQMSQSSFHSHFRQLTTMTPLQFQKWLRLNEARRLLLFHKLEVSAAGFQVGYESASQFSREYRRLFGVSPRQDRGSSASKM